ncbi:MAG TPA: hypothetical protein VM513_04895 [Kofleriaceae bacterium]|nr:hypothetical protein [Kofleriaceae bacterium]
MRKLIGISLALGLLSGCIVQNRGRRPPPSRRSSASCPPAHHWNGYRCEHNGRHRGHDKHR